VKDQDELHPFYDLSALPCLSRYLPEQIDQAEVL
jgi:hypothetical protein